MSTAMQVLSDSRLEQSMQRAQRLTREAASQVDALVFSFGHLEMECPERKLLEHKVREILHDWSEQIWDCGGLAQEMWTVLFHTEAGPVKWQHPHSEFFEQR